MSAFCRVRACVCVCTVASRLLLFCFCSVSLLSLFFSVLFCFVFVSLLWTRPYWASTSPSSGLNSGFAAGHYLSQTNPVCNLLKTCFNHNLPFKHISYKWFVLQFYNWKFLYTSHRSHACYIPFLSHPSCVDHIHDILWRVQIMKIVIHLFSLLRPNLLTSSANYSLTLRDTLSQHTTRSSTVLYLRNFMPFRRHETVTDPDSSAKHKT